MNKLIVIVELITLGATLFLLVVPKDNMLRQYHPLQINTRDIYDYENINPIGVPNIYAPKYRKDKTILTNTLYHLTLEHQENHNCNVTLTMNLSFA